MPCLVLAIITSSLRRKISLRLLFLKLMWLHNCDKIQSDIIRNYGNYFSVKLHEGKYWFSPLKKALSCFSETRVDDEFANLIFLWLKTPRTSSKITFQNHATDKVKSKFVAKVLKIFLSCLHFLESVYSLLLQLVNNKETWVENEMQKSFWFFPFNGDENHTLIYDRKSGTWNKVRT